MHTLAHSFRSFAHEHDDVPAFHAAYLVSTFLAAAMLHLGFFAILIALHMCLDYVKYRDYFRLSITQTFRAMLLESVVDIALFFTALTFEVYLSETFALEATSGLLRSGLTLLRAVGTIIPKIHILERAISVIISLHAYLYTPHPDLRTPFSRMQRVSLVVIGVTSIMLIVAAGYFAGHMSDFYRLIADELSIHL